MNTRFALVGIVFVALLPGCNDDTTTTSSASTVTITNTQSGTNPVTSTLTAKETLGQKLFFDTSLSSPIGQACSSCHNPANAFTDPNQQRPTSEGATLGRFDERNAPSAAYALYSPEPYVDVTLGDVGGLFWDGRANNLTTQAQAPFLDPKEMGNISPAAVINKVAQASYADLMQQVYGQDAFTDIGAAYSNITDAIAAFERTAAFHPFNSKYDAYVAGKATLNAQEAEGLQLFNSPQKGNCAACHTSTPAANGTPALFTNFSYTNIGLPSNPAIILPIDVDASDFKDHGRSGGKFKVPTLRNIAKTAPYGHNGVFTTLREVVAFHNNRDSGAWAEPEIAENLDTRTGNLALTDTEIDALVAFLETLSDGYIPAARTGQ
jgi:cytochrome c peroxidase